VRPKPIEIDKLGQPPAPNSLLITWETSVDGMTFVTAPGEGIVVSGTTSLVVKIPRKLLGISESHGFAFFIELMEKGLLRERYPERGTVELTSPGLDFEAEQWMV
jgi:hypothetical protein